MKEDAISRQATLEHIQRLDHLATLPDGDFVVRLSEVEDAIINGLPAQPQRMRGRWVTNSPATMKCDQCGIVIKDWDWFRFKICPGCGARMENGGKAE